MFDAPCALTGGAREEYSCMAISHGLIGSRYLDHRQFLGRKELHTRGVEGQTAVSPPQILLGMSRAVDFLQEQALFRGSLTYLR